MLQFLLLLLLFALAVDILQGDLLRLDKTEVEEQIHLGHSLREPAALVQPHEFDGVAAFVAAVAVPAGLVNLERCGLLSVEGAADVSAPVGFESVVLHDLPGGDRVFDDRGGLHDGHEGSPARLGSVRISMILSPVSSLWQKWNSTPYLVAMVWMVL